MHHLKTLLRPIQSSPYRPHMSLWISLELWPIAHKIALHFAALQMLTTATCAPSLLSWRFSLELHMKKTVSAVKTYNYIPVKFQHPSRNTNAEQKLSCIAFRPTLVHKALNYFRRSPNEIQGFSTSGSNSALLQSQEIATYVCGKAQLSPCFRTFPSAV